MQGDTLVVTLNSDHAFYERILRPAKDADPQGLGVSLELFILAMGRADLEVRTHGTSGTLGLYHNALGRTAELFLSGKSTR